MEIENYFTDKNRNYRTYHTIVDSENNCYSEILFHKVKWYIGDRPDITDLEDIWAEDIIQAIIDGKYFGDFQALTTLENGEDECLYLEWKIMDGWDGWS